MGDLTTRKKRLKLHKEFLKSAGNWNSNPEYLKLAPGYDPESLESATAFFELDHADPSHLLMLALILADVVFGKRRPGPQKGVKTSWDKRKSWELVWAYDEDKEPAPGLPGRRDCEAD